MYLRRLEILGFKSFAQKTELNFPLGVTAVVGPNGCGKSNVLDAIRWCLGEQSAKALRGGEMADVIFNGADTRQPVGMAEVTMTFTDCEAQLGTAYHEVSITRRVYRDGKGEYLLNKTLCRLRDIQELFMDTGIGRSAYSIMEQGKIDLILSSRPEDRRAVFEEAAGITKYKSQRRDATRKLEQTEVNLARLTDVLAEVKRQSNSLQRQAAKARRHATVSADLRLLDTHLAHEQYSRLARDLAATETELARARDAQGQDERELANGESALAEARATSDDASARFQEARTAAAECRDRLRAAESRREFNRERATESAGLRERYEAELSGAEERLRSQEEAMHAAAEEEAQIAALLKEGRARLDRQDALVREARTKRTQAEAAFNNLQRVAVEEDRRIQTLRAELATFAQQQQAGDVRKELLAAELTRLEPARAEADTRLVDARAGIASGQTALAARRDELRAGEEAVAAAQKELAAAEQTLAKAAKAQAARSSRLEVLRGLNEAGAGFSAGTQAVLRGLDRPELFRPAIIGVLGSSIDVETRFIPAVEAVLGAHLQTILLRDDEVAAELLDTLATGKKVGRATLLPLPSRLAPAARTARNPALPDGALTWARDAVETSPTVAPLLARLLADAVVAETLPLARELRRAYPDLAVATLAGELLDRDGSLQGGQSAGDQSAQAGVLQRQSQIRALEKESAAGQKEVADLTHARTAAANKSQAAAAALSDARQSLQAAQVHVSTLQSQFAFIERESRDLAARADNLSREQADAERRVSAARDAVAAAETRLAAASSSLETHQSERAAAAEATDTARAQEGTLTEALNEVRLSVATEQGRHESLRRQRQPMDARRVEIAELIDRRRHELAEHARRLEKYGSDASALDAEIDFATANLATADQVIAARRDEHTGAAAAAETLENDLRVRRQSFNTWHDRRASHEVREAQLRLRQENLHAHVAERFNVDLRGFSPQPPVFGELYARLTEQSELLSAEPDWSRVEDLVRSLREKLDGMGAVNSDAIAEYEALEERHNFLETQNTDLVTAKKDLLAIIARINNTSRDLFAETFERVRVNFQEMFTELFGGGKANLLLVNEQDPLECGIDIIARPPGKQLQSVTLMSGGEKTMTAVALLFAVYMVKPSPFCVLDEMDAPLDESNIARFLKILDRFVSQSQFVVITHNKRTIARADVLYGVTMEEAGVSKLVAVRMAKRERETGVGNDLMGTANASALPGAIDEAARAAGHNSDGPSVAESFGKSERLHSEAVASASPGVSP